MSALKIYTDENIIIAFLKHQQKHIGYHVHNNPRLISRFAYNIHCTNVYYN